jgi:hypothetical protein
VLPHLPFTVERLAPPFDGFSLGAGDWNPRTFFVCLFTIHEKERFLGKIPKGSKKNCPVT